jgi:hypothetical protein
MTSCMYAGHFPGLPPTPKPLGIWLEPRKEFSPQQLGGMMTRGRARDPASFFRKHPPVQAGDTFGWATVLERVGRDQHRREILRVQCRTCQRVLTTRTSCARKFSSTCSHRSGGV